MKIFIDCTWTHHPASWFSSFIPPNPGFTLVDSLIECDKHVVINQSRFHREKPDLVYESEPAKIRETWNHQDYDRSRSIANWRMPWHWNNCHIGYANLMDLRGSPNRIDKVVAISSDKAFMAGHHRRHLIQKALGKSRIDVYGHTQFPGENFCGGLHLKHITAAYRYQLAVENTFGEQNYVTEKLIDSLLFRCLTFYMGNNAEDFINPEAFIRLSPAMSDDEVVELIESHMANNTWEKRRGLIESEARRVLAEESLFPKMIEHLQ